MPIQTEEATDFEFIINLVYERCRVRLHEGKHQLIRARLGKRMRALGIATLGEYCDLLRRNEGAAELTHMVDALTTNFTNFLREKDHFEFMIQTALPELLAERKQFKIWSAACATGEEPFTISFFLADRYPPELGWDWQVLASDISTKALGHARRAIYAQERLSTLPPGWWPRFFQKGHGQWEGHYRVKPHITTRVDFQQLNLLGPYNFSDQFPVIFCRNVMIYFDRPTQEQLVRQLARHLPPKGYLLIGHSESLNGLQLPLRCVRPSIYQKL